MSRHYGLFLIIGIIIFILPFAGIPASWTDIVHFSTGLILIVIAIVYRNVHRYRMKQTKEMKEYGDAHEESSPQNNFSGKHIAHSDLVETNEVSNETPDEISSEVMHEKHVA